MREAAVPAEARVTCWWYVLNRGLTPRYGTMEWLLEIGRRAWGAARWEGIPERKVPEGPLWVHSWPERIWVQVIAELDEGSAERDRCEAAARDVTAYPGPRGEQAGWDTGCPEERDAGWGPGGVPWDGDDIRPY